MVFELGDNVYFEVIELSDGESNNNNNCVVYRPAVEDVRFLFAGNLEGELELNALINSGKQMC